jgi:hypothetical protein
MWRSAQTEQLAVSTWQRKIFCIEASNYIRYVAIFFLLSRGLSSIWFVLSVPKCRLLIGCAERISDFSSPTAFSNLFLNSFAMQCYRFLGLRTAPVSRAWQLQRYSTPRIGLGCGRSVNHSTVEQNATPACLVAGQKYSWQVVVGLEIHTQLCSRSKLFSGKLLQTSHNGSY